MANLFKAPSMPAPIPIPQPKPPPTPKVKRLPTETDPAVLAASRRTYRNAIMRRGRASTVLTDRTRETVGSSGQKLGG